jgi:hypothetical protein
MILTTLMAATALASPALVEAKITAASLFKNGYAVVVRSAPLSADGEVLIESPPRSVLGTLWVTASRGVTIDSVVTTTVGKEITSGIGSLEALLDANQGKRLTIWIVQPGQTQPASYTGTLVNSTGSLLVLQMEDGTTRALQKNRVYEVTSSTGDLVYQVKGESRSLALRIRARGAGNVMVLSLERGLTWVPGYHVDITDEKKLKVTSKATIMNDLGDLENIDLKLITGFPHVRFINAWDPLTSGMTVDQFVGGLMQLGAAAADAAPMAQNAYAGRMAEGGGFGGGGGFEPFDPGQLEGQQLEDLFFYTLPRVTLDKGERGYYVQFQEEADYEHVYTLDLPETGWATNEAEYRGMPTPDSIWDVWHTLEFTNPSQFPLTTAAATTFKDGQIIGQDMLNYTAPKSKATLKITKALDIRPDLVEEELDRQINAIPRTSYTRGYDLITAKGTIQLVNYKSQTVKVKVLKQLVGEVTSASHNGAVVKNRVGLRAVNPNSEVRWTLDLKAGEKVELTYNFKVYVPTP